MSQMTARELLASLTADDPKGAPASVRRDSLSPQATTDERETDLDFDWNVFQRISRKDILALTNQLAVMVDAGIPVATALASVVQQTEKPSLKRVLLAVQHDVEGGESFSSALARQGSIFDATYVNLIKAAESSGTLPEMLERLATQMQRSAETRQKVLGAMMYPALMMVMCAASTVFLLTYVFPKVQPLFTLKKIELPWSTQVLMTASHTLTEHWPWWIAGSIAVAGSAWWFGRIESGRALYDWCWLRLPILGNLIRKNCLTQSLRTLSMTINSGVPMLDSLELCAAVCKNVHYRNIWLKVCDEVAGGRQMHEALTGNALIPRSLVQMIDAGEKSGQLGPVLSKISRHYDNEIETTIKSATSLIEPLMIITMGGVVGGLAMAMLLPIFQLSGHGS